jgi:hypothetical protein
VFCSDLKNGILHTLEATIFILLGEIVVGNVAIIVFEHLLISPRSPSLEIADFIAVRSATVISINYSPVFWAQHTGCQHKFLNHYYCKHQH